jgi:putative oxidoreductase
MTVRMHWKNGFFLQNGGNEYPFTLAIASLVIGLIGPGGYALDMFLNIALPEVPLFGVLAAAALLVDIIGIIVTSHNGADAQPENASRAS